MRIPGGYVLPSKPFCLFDLGAQDGAWLLTDGTGTHGPGKIS